MFSLSVEENGTGARQPYRKSGVTPVLRVRYLEITPGEFEIGALTCTEVITD